MKKLLLLIFGGLFLSMGLSMLVQTLRLLMRGRQGPGKIVSFNVLPHQEDGRTHDMYYPVVRFQTPTGKAQEFVGDVGAGAPAYQVGQEVTVLYQPDSPEAARILKVGELWAPPIVGMLFGGFLLACLFIEEGE